MVSLRGELEVEHQRAEDALKAFYEIEESATMEDTNINIGMEQVLHGLEEISRP